MEHFEAATPADSISIHHSTICGKIEVNKSYSGDMRKGKRDLGSREKQLFLIFSKDEAPFIPFLLQIRKGKHYSLQ